MFIINGMAPKTQNSNIYLTLYGKVLPIQDLIMPMQLLYLKLLRSMWALQFESDPGEPVLSACVVLHAPPCSRCVKCTLLKCSVPRDRG